MFSKVAFTMYPVKDPTRARAFYEETLGFERGPISSPDGMWTEYDLPGGGCLALFGGKEGPEPSAKMGACVAFEVEDLDTLVSQLEESGVTFYNEMVHSPVCRMAFILDSEGNPIILHELKKS